MATTIEKILGYSTDDLEKMSNVELQAALEPYMKACRVFPAPEVKKETVKKEKKSPDLTNQTQQLLDMIANYQKPQQ